MRCLYAPGSFQAVQLTLTLRPTGRGHPVGPLIAAPFRRTQSAPQQFANGSGQARDS
jgi:hypothetical protein